VVEELTNVATYILMTETWANPRPAFIVIDKRIVTEIDAFLDIPFLIMSIFFVILKLVFIF